MKKKIIAIVLALSLAITPIINNPDTVSAATKTKKVTIYKGQTVKYALLGIINSKVKWKVISGKNKVSIKTSGKYKKKIKIKGKKVGNAVIRAKLGKSVFKFKVKVKKRKKTKHTTTTPTTRPTVEPTTRPTQPVTRVPEEEMTTPETTVASETTTTEIETSETVIETDTERETEIPETTTKKNGKYTTVTKTISVVPIASEGESKSVELSNSKFKLESGEHYTKVKIKLDKKVENAKIIYVNGFPNNKPIVLNESYNFDESNGYSYETTGCFGTNGFVSCIKIVSSSTNVKGTAVYSTDITYNYTVNLTDVEGYDSLIIDPSYNFSRYIALFNTRPDLGEAAHPSIITQINDDNSIDLNNDTKLVSFTLDTDKTNLGIIKYTYKLIKYL